MIIVWDETKRARNIERHGLDFADFEMGFDIESALIRPAKKGRFMLTGIFGGVVIISVVAAELGTEAISLISMRRASETERRLYDER